MGLLQTLLGKVGHTDDSNNNSNSDRTHEEFLEQIYPEFPEVRQRLATGDVARVSTTNFSTQIKNAKTDVDSVWLCTPIPGEDVPVYVHLDYDGMASSRRLRSGDAAILADCELEWYDPDDGEIPDLLPHHANPSYF